MGGFAALYVEAMARAKLGKTPPKRPLHPASRAFSVPMEAERGSRFLI
jgi:hypothetical protein